jgi:hypothetical protein
MLDAFLSLLAGLSVWLDNSGNKMLAAANASFAAAASQGWQIPVWLIALLAGLNLLVDQGAGAQKALSAKVSSSSKL